MRSAWRAVACVDPQRAHFGLADVCNIGGCGGAQASPKVKRATFTLRPPVADTVQQMSNTVGQHGAAGFGQWRRQSAFSALLHFGVQ